MRVVIEHTIYGTKRDSDQKAAEAYEVPAPVKVVIETPYDDTTITQVVEMFKSALLGMGWGESLVEKIQVIETKEDFE